jgi:hypothetical protein
MTSFLYFVVGITSLNLLALALSICCGRHVTGSDVVSACITATLCIWGITLL